MENMPCEAKQSLWNAQDVDLGIENNDTRFSGLKESAQPSKAVKSAFRMYLIEDIH